MTPTWPGPRSLALLIGAALAGCPLPQTLPEYPTGGAITPPRIQSDRVTPSDTIILVDANCAGADTAHTFRLSATLVDENTYEPVEYRWFVDYDPQRSTVRPLFPTDQIIPGPNDGITIDRVVPPLDLQPYTFDPALYGVPSEPRPGQSFRDGGGLHLVELVVSNGFAPEEPTPVPAHERPFRTPRRTATQTFETQVYRWVFHYVPTGTPGARCSYP
jgi:hypothetical protein